MLSTGWTLLLLFINTRAAEGQQLICGRNEEPCPADFCTDLSCAGVAIASAQNGRCRCRFGYIRNQFQRTCERPGPNCVAGPSGFNGFEPNRQPPTSVPVCDPLNQVRFGGTCIYKVAAGQQCLTIDQCLGGSLCDRGRCICPLETVIENGRCVPEERTVIPGTPPEILRPPDSQSKSLLTERRIRGDLVPSIFQLCDSPEFEGVFDRLTEFYSMYSNLRKDHFYTADLAEVSQASIDSYTFQGPIGRIVTVNGKSVQTSTCEGLVPLMRFWYPWFQFDHFYTIHKKEMDKAVQGLFQPEGITGYCIKDKPSCGAVVALHRFWSAKNADHAYVTKQNDVQALQRDLAWSYEGVECYIWPT